MRSAFDELVSSYHDAIGLSECEITDAARAELAQLRADLQAARAQAAMLDDYAETIRLHEITITEQMRQLAEAQEIFENIFKRDWSNGKINDKARAWLAANPAPQEPQP